MLIREARYHFRLHSGFRKLAVHRRIVLTIFIVARQNCSYAEGRTVPKTSLLNNFFKKPSAVKEWKLSQHDFELRDLVGF
eukprot:SAG11_NODE_3448_length_2441_cov_3.742101_4_plen_80_part_00